MSIFDCHVYLGGSRVTGVCHNGAAIVSALQERGIDQAVVFSAHAEHVDPLAGNRILKATIEHAAGLFGCVVTHTNRSDKSIDVMRELMHHPKVVGMYITQQRPTEPLDRIVADDLLNAYRRYAKPLFIHCPNTGAARVALEIAKAFPAIRFVLLGMGGEDWKAAISAAHSATNIYLETSGLLDRAKLPAAVEAIGAHRILFGSGMPRMDPAAALGLIEDSNLGTEAKRRILGVNARKLLGLEAE